MAYAAGSCKRERRRTCEKENFTCSGIEHCRNTCRDGNRICFVFFPGSWVLWSALESWTWRATSGRENCADWWIRDSWWCRYQSWWDCLSGSRLIWCWNSTSCSRSGHTLPNGFSWSNSYASGGGFYPGWRNAGPHRQSKRNRRADADS